MLIGAVAGAPTARSIRCGGEGARRDLDGARVKSWRARLVRSTARYRGAGIGPRGGGDVAIDSEKPVQRVSLTCREALRLARILLRLVDDLTFVERAT
jgi:hypothetical protein